MIPGVWNCNPQVPTQRSHPWRIGPPFPRVRAARTDDPLRPPLFKSRGGPLGALTSPSHDFVSASHMCDVQFRFVFLWGPASIEHLKIPLLLAKPKPGCRLQNVTRHSLQAGVNGAHCHGQVRWGEHLTGAACHALGGNSSSKPCPGLSQDHQPGFPEMPWLYLQLA